MRGHASTYLERALRWHTLDKGTTGNLLIPQFCQGVWIMARGKFRETGKTDEERANHRMKVMHKTMNGIDGNDSDEGRITKTAYGMQVAVRFVMVNMPEKAEKNGYDKIKLDIYEHDLKYDDRVEQEKELTSDGILKEREIEAKFKFQIDHRVLYETDPILIGSKDYWETTGRETLAQFYFKPRFELKKLNKTFEKILPTDEKNFLRVHSPESTPNEQILEIAYLYDKTKGTGGNYHWSQKPYKGGMGMPEGIIVKNNYGEKKVWSMKSIDTTYCSGFTFWCIMLYLQSNRITDTIRIAKLEEFQERFYKTRAFADGDFYVNAILWLGIGKKVGENVNDGDCILGDLIQLLKGVGNGGHSVIFIDYLRDSKKNIIWITYRGKKYVKGILCRGSHGEPGEEADNTGGIFDKPIIFKIDPNDRTNKWSATRSIAARITATGD